MYNPRQTAPPVEPELDSFSTQLADLYGYARDYTCVARTFGVKRKEKVGGEFKDRTDQYEVRVLDIRQLVALFDLFEIPESDRPIALEWLEWMHRVEGAELEPSEYVALTVLDSPEVWRRIELIERHLGVPSWLRPQVVRDELVRLETVVAELVGSLN